MRRAAQRLPAKSVAACRAAHGAALKNTKLSSTRGSAPGIPRSGDAAYTRSKMPAAPMPVPTHMVTMPYLRLLRRSAWITVAARIAPVAPSG